MAEALPPGHGGDDRAPDSLINVKVTNSAGIEIFFKLRRGTRLGKLMEAYSKRMGLVLRDIRFSHRGQLLNANDTPHSREMDEGDAIVADPIAHLCDGAQGSFEIVIKCLQKGRVVLRVCPTTLIGHIRKSLASRFKVASRRLRVLYSGKVLEDPKDLSFYGILEEQTTILVVIMGSSGSQSSAGGGLGTFASASAAAASAAPPAAAPTYPVFRGGMLGPGMMPPVPPAAPPAPAAAAAPAPDDILASVLGGMFPDEDEAMTPEPPSDAATSERSAGGFFAGWSEGRSGDGRRPQQQTQPQRPPQFRPPPQPQPQTGQQAAQGQQQVPPNPVAAMFQQMQGGAGGAGGNPFGQMFTQRMMQEMQRGGGMGAGLAGLFGAGGAAAGGAGGTPAAGTPDIQAGVMNALGALGRHLQAASARHMRGRAPQASSGESSGEGDGEEQGQGGDDIFGDEGGLLATIVDIAASVVASAQGKDVEEVRAKFMQASKQVMEGGPVVGKILTAIVRQIGIEDIMALAMRNFAVIDRMQDTARRILLAELFAGDDSDETRVRVFTEFMDDLRKRIQDMPEFQTIVPVAADRIAGGDRLLRPFGVYLRAALDLTMDGVDAQGARPLLPGQGVQATYSGRLMYVIQQCLLQVFATAHSLNPGIDPRVVGRLLGRLCSLDFDGNDWVLQMVGMWLYDMYQQLQRQPPPAPPASSPHFDKEGKM